MINICFIWIWFYSISKYYKKLYIIINTTYNKAFLSLFGKYVIFLELLSTFEIDIFIFAVGDPIFVVLDPKEIEFLFTPAGYNLFREYFIYLSLEFKSIPDSFLLCCIAIPFITFVLLNTFLLCLRLLL